MGNNISISWPNGCIIFDEIDKIRGQKSKSNMTIELLDVALKYRKMDNFFVDDAAPRDETPLPEWKAFLKSKDKNSIKSLLKKRREINTLLENVLLD